MPNALTALFGGALAGLLVIGLLLLRMRGILGALRRRYAQAADQGGAAEPNAQDERTEQGGKAGPAVAADPVPAVTATVAPDVTGSLLLRPDIGSFQVPEDAGAAGVPLYRATIDSLRWNPAGPGNRRDPPG